MKYAEVAENVKKLVENPPPNDEFIYEILLAYGTPKATIARLKSGSINLSKEPGEVLLKKKVWFKSVETNVAQASRLPDAVEPKVGQASSLSSPGEPSDGGQAGSMSYIPSDSQQARHSLYVEIEELKVSKKTKTNDPRFLIVTDFTRILAVDRKTNDSLDIQFEELELFFDFFLPWAGMEKTKLSNENPADVKAAEKMAKLFDAIKQDNADYLRHDAHAMNVFLGRLLFCLFAEDTNIFPENAVSNAIASHTAEDGSDLDVFFKQLFDWLDTSDAERGINREGSQGTQKQGQVLTTKHTNDTKGESLRSLRSFAVNSLPYVNGGLFRDHYDIPGFSAKSRRMLIEAGTLDWKDINPDIFGSMFQAVIDPEERHNLGQHYTSVTNIMKVIEPLFLNEFKEELEKAKGMTRGKRQALHRLLDRIANVKIFDPACGSGNFLIIAYKELRRLEMGVFDELQTISKAGEFPISRMCVSRFYGIEIDDFACGTAVLALWLAEHQMNLEYKKRFGHTITSLPLKDGANIVCDNAARKDWEEVCPKDLTDEIYVFGNPPYLGARMQDDNQKADLSSVFHGFENYKNLDYISCWFLKGASYIRGVNAQCGFVSTNSICQGEQVALLWPQIFDKGLEIKFAHQSFKWANNAKGSAAVICVVVGISNQRDAEKVIYNDGLSHRVKNINAYLAAADNLFITKATKSICNAPVLRKGSQPTDGGNLILSPFEKDELVGSYPDAERLLKKFIGSSEFIRGNDRWCLWISDSDLDLALSIPPVAERIEKVRQVRLQSPKKATQGWADRPHRFTETRHSDSQAIIIPSVSSERREYIPTGFLDGNTVVSNLAFTIAGAEAWPFGLISSQMHMVWMRAVAGRLKTDYRYSAGLCYNTFPIPDLTEAQKQTITMHVGNVLQERENHSGKTMAQLYDPDKMPDGLREAHHNLDLAVDRLYRSKPFTSDEERLEHLFKLYEEMTAKEKLI